ncbi:MAG: hypothetical protein HYX69_19580 [Planctomycetia bacterium]|nr:hypothetical protein [Planctomycetia bacterium]
MPEEPRVATTAWRRLGFAIALLAALVPAASAWSQISRLPPVEAGPPAARLPPPPETAIFERPAETLAMVPPSGDGPAYVTDPRDPSLPYELLDPDEQNAVLAPARPPGAKDGILQFTTFRKVFLLRGNRETGMGISDLTLQTILAFPLLTRETPLLITPYFGAHFLAGPVPVDLPPVLYDVSLEFRVLRQVTPWLGADLAVAPSIFNDFRDWGHGAFRVTGRGLGLVTLSPTWQLAAGVAYLGRADAQILPVGGLIWTPNEDWRVEAIVPRPRIIERFLDGFLADWWVYLAGEFGGNTYAIQRAAGFDDLATYRDFRVQLGLERKADSGSYHRFEVGYVFGRKVEYASGTPSFDPSNTVMFRAEATF